MTFINCHFCNKCLVDKFCDKGRTFRVWFAFWLRHWLLSHRLSLWFWSCSSAPNIEENFEKDIARRLIDLAPLPGRKWWWSLVPKNKITNTTMLTRTPIIFDWCLRCMQRKSSIADVVTIKSNSWGTAMLDRLDYPGTLVLMRSPGGAYKIISGNAAAILVSFLLWVRVGNSMFCSWWVIGTSWCGIEWCF